MTTFNGFSEEIFECCEASEKIRKPINALKELQSEIEPELKRINPNLSGHVSKTKIAGTNSYNDWAWLYFNTIGPRAYRHSQITVNVSPDRLYVGANLRILSEYLAFRNEIEKEENRLLFEQIIDTLSGREWIISKQGDWWERQTPRSYSSEELRGILLDPELYWINACFEKNEPILRDRRILDEIIQIFKELYNIYALSSGNRTILQPKPKYKVFEHEIIVDSEEYLPKSDSQIMLEAKKFLSSLKSTKKLGKFHLSGRKDQYSINTIALEFDLKPYQLQYEGKTMIIYSDKSIKPYHDRILKNYSHFCMQLDNISKLLDLPEGFLKIMFVDLKSDARYYRRKGSNSIFLNLARFEKNKNWFFWLFAAAREITYLRIPRLSYRFINKLRDILTVALMSYGHELEVQKDFQGYC